MDKVISDINIFLEPIIVSIVGKRKFPAYGMRLGHGTTRRLDPRSNQEMMLHDW